MKTALHFLFTIIIVLIYQTEVSSQGITARQNKQVLDSMAYKINSAVQLVYAESDSLLQDGTSLVWSYQYRVWNGGNQINYYFHSDNKTTVYDSLNNQLIIGVAYITKYWIDSDSALAIAEKQGGETFRKNNPRYKIKAILSEPFVPLNTPEWYIQYISLEGSNNSLLATVGAEDTNIVEYVNSAIGKVPKTFTLSQNYPNPFNPSTTINYSLPDESRVTIKVYNVLGKEVETLINEEKNAGNYKVEFKNCNLPSGVYFYKMQAGNYLEIKKLMLLK
ncbi:MAG: T9SS type A sorting domain-containing protein [Ignavibacteriaceae bacterium]|nr:T9SS type A sorting domain-containing protein [Ignavibacteriaceae bacterium]